MHFKRIAAEREWVVATNAEVDNCFAIRIHMPTDLEVLIARLAGPTDLAIVDLEDKAGGAASGRRRRFAGPFSIERSTRPSNRSDGHCQDGQRAEVLHAITPSERFSRDRYKTLRCEGDAREDVRCSRVIGPHSRESLFTVHVGDLANKAEPIIVARRP